MHLIHSIDNRASDFKESIQNEAICALEKGQVIYLPNIYYPLSSSENILLSPEYVKPGVKNISYNPHNFALKGIESSVDIEDLMLEMIQRYVVFSTTLIERLFPYYQGKYETGKTSYRPVEIYGRPSSYRKDDTRLHVDAFPSNPNHGKRILRVFSNINPHNKSRHWRIGESFEAVANRFLNKIPAPIWGINYLLRMIAVTKQVRSDYDHYMLQIHNRMKADENYQKTVEQIDFHFPPYTTWIVMTDKVSHAALAGQYVLEQTYYLPAGAMLQPEQAPLKILERMSGRKLA